MFLWCTTLRDVIQVERCFIGVMSMTCILHHAVVCWITAIKDSYFVVKINFTTLSSKCGRVQDSYTNMKLPISSTAISD
jgi:hypothetical protein